MTYELKVDGFVAELILSAPGSLNRFDADSHQDLSTALRTLRALDGVRAAVIGSTGRVFSAGGDYELMIQAYNDPHFLAGLVDEGKSVLTSLIDTPFPVIAAVQGPAIGLGASIALSCDMVVAARTATFADPHVQVGLAAGDGGCLVWPHATGGLRAKRYLLTGDRLGAEDAYHFGLVTDLVDTAGEVLPAARALAARVAALPPVAVQGTKRALNNVLRHRAAEVVDLAFAYEVAALHTDDFVEAVAAAKEKRQGSYLGH